MEPGSSGLAAGIERKRDSRSPSGLKESKDLEFVTGKAEECPVGDSGFWGNIYGHTPEHTGVPSWHRVAFFSSCEEPKPLDRGHRGHLRLGFEIEDTHFLCVMKQR